MFCLSWVSRFPAPRYIGKVCPSKVIVLFELILYFFYTLTDLSCSEILYYEVNKLFTGDKKYCNKHDEASMMDFVKQRSFSIFFVITIALAISSCNLFEKPVRSPDLSRIQWNQFSSFALLQTVESSASSSKVSLDTSDMTLVARRTLLGFYENSTAQEEIELSSRDGDKWRVDRIEKATDEWLILFLRSKRDDSAWLHVMINRSSEKIYNISEAVNAFFSANDFFVDSYADYTRDPSLLTIVHGNQVFLGPVYGHVLEIDLASQTVRPINNAEFDIIQRRWYGSSSGHVLAMVSSIMSPGSRGVTKYFPGSGQPPTGTNSPLTSWLSFARNFLAAPGSDIVYSLTTNEKYRFSDSGIETSTFELNTVCGFQFDTLSYGSVFWRNSNSNSNTLRLKSVSDTTRYFYHGQAGKLFVLSTALGELDCRKYEVPKGLSGGMALVRNMLFYDRDSIGIYAFDLQSGQEHVVTDQNVLTWESVGDRVIYSVYETAVNISTFSSTFEGQDRRKVSNSQIHSVSLVVF